MDSNKRIKYGWAIPCAVILCILFAIVFLLSVNNIWIIDSLEYQYNFSSHEHIADVWDIFTSQYAHYFTWNGRYVAHWLCQFFLALIGKTGFSICNGLVYILYVLVIMRYTGMDLKDWRGVLLTTLLVLFFCDTIYAPNWQICYVWIYCLTLVFIMAFFSDRCRHTKGVWSLVLLFMFSIVCGNGHESFNIGVGAALCIYVLFNFRRIELAQYVMLAGFAVGGLIICLSPATMGRASAQSIPLSFTLLHMLADFRCFYLLLVLVVTRALSGHLHFKGWYNQNAFEINTILILIAVNVVMGVGGARQLMGIELMSVVLILRMFRHIRIQTAWLVVASIIILGVYGLKFTEVMKAKNAYSQLKQAINDRVGETVYVDLPVYNEFVNPTATMKYGVYFNYVVWSAITDINGDYYSGDIDFNVCPAQVRDVVERNTPSDTVVEYLPGEFLVMLTDNSPAHVVLHREVGLAGVKMSLPDTEICLTDENCTKLGEYQLLYLPKNTPLVTNVGVDILGESGQ